VLRSEVEKMTFELNRPAREAMANIPACISGILAATTDQAEVFRLLTQEIVQAMEVLGGDPELDYRSSKASRVPIATMLPRTSMASKSDRNSLMVHTSIQNVPPRERFVKLGCPQ
jgi:hypothetical protein